jgi:hypothetical protein
MIPVIAAPFAAMLGSEDAALGMLVLAVALFQLFRGVGLVANNPVLNFLANGPDKSSYMTQTQVINNAVSMLAGFAIAICLGGSAPIWMYSIIAVAGVVCGVTAGIAVGKVPEPPPEETAKSPSLFVIFKQALKDIPVKNFVGIFFLVALCSGVTRTFIIVYAREVFEQGDGMVSLYGVFGAFGSFLIGLFIKFLVERIGAKPLFIICTALGFAGVMLLVFLHVDWFAGNVTAVIMALSFIFLLINFAFIGAENISQTYFICLVPKELMLDMGIVYFIVFGISGSIGSFFSGVILDALTGMNLSRMLAFKILFIIMGMLLAAALVLQRKLISLGGLTMKDALEVIFSFRDLRTISILDKLDKSEDVEQEQELLVALHEKPSRLAISGLLERARSPRFATRTEAFEAMDAQQHLNDEAKKALMDDITGNPYTTAHQSARILGNHKCTEAVDLLRQSAHSDDYMLAGEAMIALAKLNDMAYRAEIERIIAATSNPRLLIMGVEAFGIYKSVDSLPALFNILKTTCPPPYLRDEVVLAMAGILDIYNLFHKLLVRYIAAPSMMAALALDEVESACEYCRSALSHRGKSREARDEKSAVLSAAAAFQDAVKALTGQHAGAAAAAAESGEPAPLARWLLTLPAAEDDNQTKALILSEAIIEDDIRPFQRVQLLVVQWAARRLRMWADAARKRY